MNLKIFPFVAVSAILLVACSSAPKVVPTPTFNPSQLKGQALFNLRCAQCHALVPETTIVGPSLANIATRAETRVEGYDAQSYIETSILIPGDYVVEGFEDIMPKNFGKDLTSEELDDVVQYLLLQK